MHRKFFIILLTASLLVAGCGTKNVTDSSQTSTLDTTISASAEIENPADVDKVDSNEEVQTGDAQEAADKTSENGKSEPPETNPQATKDIEYSTIYDTVKGWGENNTKSIKASRVINLLDSQGYFLPADGERMMLASSCNNYVKIHDSESDYQDTILISNLEGTYSLNQLSTTSITDSGNNSAQTTVLSQKTFVPLDAKSFTSCGFSKTIIPTEGLINELTESKETYDSMLPPYTKIIRDFSSHIDDDYIFDATYQKTDAGDSVYITVYQNIDGSEWGLVGNQYALFASINIGSGDKLQMFSLSITAATNESYAYHADNEYQVQCNLTYNYDEESISDTLKTDLKSEKEKADKKNKKTNKK